MSMGGAAAFVALARQVRQAQRQQQREHDRRRERMTRRRERLDYTREYADVEALVCPRCRQEYDLGAVCPECGVEFVCSSFVDSVDSSLAVEPAESARGPLDDTCLGVVACGLIGAMMVTVWSHPIGLGLGVAVAQLQLLLLG